MQPAKWSRPAHLLLCSSWKKVEQNLLLLVGAHWVPWYVVLIAFFAVHALMSCSGSVDLFSV